VIPATRTCLALVAATALALASCTGGGGGSSAGGGGGTAAGSTQGGTSAPGGGGTGGPSGGGAASGVPATATIRATPSGATATAASCDVELLYDLAHPASLPIAIDVEYSTDGGSSWAPAASGAGGDGTSGLASAPAPGAPRRFVWAAAEDVRATRQARVKLRVTPRAPTPGVPAETGTFAVDGTPLSVPVRLRRYPYVQNVVGDRATIVWFTDAPASGEVAVGPTAALGAVALSNGGAPATRHEVEVSGLAPGARAFYRVASNGVPLGPVERFRAAPDGSTAGFTMAVIGDSGTGSSRQWQVARQIEAFDPDMLLHTGDVIYPYGEASKYDPHFFQPYRDIARGAPFFMSMGNHDILTSFGGPYLDAFVLPRNARDNSEKYYSFEYGNAKFIALDSSLSFIIPGSGQHLWLIDELSKPRPDWLFVYFHHPPYSTGTHGSDYMLRYLASPLFEQAEVDVVFTGHDHHFERTHAVRDFASGKRGVVYYVTGGAGAATRSVSGNASWSAVSEEVGHFLGVSVAGRTLRVDAIRADGTTIETFTIVK
jgi:3',5'-cyclic AMP phosphodiesterase CpdA